ncbi:hypothetical protein NDU88_001687 [Pleurodeles waltl]|uniref:Uncharacterized protein n=1 Tax=Pleurodeles waltl TaxID=8319 RepID=A0AAV7ND69_PLEWA|nr:hypothetical protein NDU88_001687 [Pleurodeles waltl]
MGHLLTPSGCRHLAEPQVLQALGPSCPPPSAKVASRFTTGRRALETRSDGVMQEIAPEGRQPREPAAGRRRGTRVRPP